MDENGTGIMLRFWTQSGKRVALWRVFYAGRFEYHVTHRGITIVEDFYADRALRRAGATLETYRALVAYYERPENAVPVLSEEVA